MRNRAGAGAGASARSSALSAPQRVELTRLRYNRLPTDLEIAQIPCAVGAEFELSTKEVATLRRHLYAVNRDGIRRYRTMREGLCVLVWRIK